MHQLLIDPDFSFIERKQVQTSLLELNDHKETDICNILAWLFNAKEGHLQGEYFLKALINGIYQTATATQLAEMPSAVKMLTLSLSRFTIMTEVAIQQSKNRRIDLLMVDVTSKTIIVFERKDGSGAHDGQLKDYFDWAEGQYKDWDRIYILSDSFAKDHGEEYHPSFIQLDDTWLTTALLDLIQRENLTSRLEYILRDLHDFVFSSWEEKRDPFYRDLNKRIERLVHNHIDLTQDLDSFQITVLGKIQKIMSITPNYYFTNLSTLRNELYPVEYELLTLIHAHYDGLEALEHYTGFEFLVDKIKERYPCSKEDIHNNELSLINNKHGLDDDYYWPYALTIKRILDKEGVTDTYKVSISANRNCSEAELSIAEKFSELNGFKVRSNWKYKAHIIAENITSLSLSGELLKAIDDFYKKSFQL